MFIGYEGLVGRICVVLVVFIDYIHCRPFIRRLFSSDGGAFAARNDS